MKNNKYLDAIFKVAYTPAIPKSFKNYLIDCVPAMASFDELRHQYPVTILVDEYINNLDLYNSKKEKEFIQTLIDNGIKYIEI